MREDIIEFLKMNKNKELQQVLKDIKNGHYHEYKDAKNIYIDNKYIYVDGEKAFEISEGHVDEFFDV